jgi:hypothetical protein
MFGGRRVHVCVVVCQTGGQCRLSGHEHGSKRYRMCSVSSFIVVFINKMTILYVCIECVRSATTFALLNRKPPVPTIRQPLVIVSSMLEICFMLFISMMLFVYCRLNVVFETIYCFFFNLLLIYHSDFKSCVEARQCPSAGLIGLFSGLICGADSIPLP